MNSITSSLFATLLLLANATSVSARRCYYDSRYQRYRCESGLRRAARIGLGIGLAVLALLLLLIALCILRRRRRRALQHSGGLPPPVTGGGFHEKPAEQQPGNYQPHPGGPNQTGFGAADYPVNQPQFPAPSYQAGTGYAPPAGPPPSTYAPPSGPPPAK